MVDAPTGQVYTYHYNGIGSTVAMTDQDKNMVNKYYYTAFGILTNEEETIPQPFKYVAQYGIMYEPNGLYYMRARYYDAETGRFISEDPIGFGGGDVNLYAYVGNNPVNFVDPLGLTAGDTNASNTWVEVWDIITPDFNDPTSLGANFWQNIYNDPPTAGISFSLYGQTVSFSTAGASYNFNPSTLVGASLNFQSWAPIGDTEIGIGFPSYHTSIGVYPQPGVNPWAVHYGVGISWVPVYVSERLAGASWKNGSASGVLVDIMERSSR